MREGKFQTIASREIWSIVCGGATGLTLAWFGYGIWALVAQSLIDNFADTAFLFWRSTWRPKWVFERNAFLDLWQFSKPLIGARLFTYFNRNVDTILIGRFLGAAPLGFYNLGYQFVLLPLTYVTRPFSKVLFTTLSRVQHDEIRLRNGYLQSIQLLSFVIFPLMTLIALEVPDLIGLLLGEKWQPASALIPYFCFVGLIQSVLNVMPAVFQATGHTNLILRWNFTTVMVNILAFSIGLAWGIQGVAIAYTLGTLVLAPFLQNALLRALHLPWALFGHALLKPILISLMMVGVWAMSGWGMAAIDLNASPFVGDILQSSVAIAAYLAISWYWNQTFKNTLGRLRIGHRIKCYQQKLSIS